MHGYRQVGGLRPPSEAEGKIQIPKSNNQTNSNEEIINMEKNGH
jgi:hypothetical protein